MDKGLFIIPQPQFIERRDGHFNLGFETNIYVSKDLKELINYLKESLFDFLPFNQSLPIITINDEDPSDLENAIIFKKVSDNLETPEEGYSLNITENNILLTARTKKGVFYGIQSLKQLFFSIENNKENGFFLPSVMISDYPRFPWRGFMLDEGRHFHGKQTVKKIIDLLALLKFNTFHWHLTEDQGWRIEIKSFPKLIEIGSKRKKTQKSFRSYVTKEFDNKPHEGYYTQKDLKEIIDYATKRFITIIPEIDMPGHISAAIASYPQLSCNEKPIEVATTFGIKKDILCVGKEFTFEFLLKVLQEVTNVFPGDFFHLGGDEVPKDRWKECPNCQKRMEEENLSSVKDLETYFFNRIMSFLVSNGKKPIIWNDALSSKLINGFYCQHWLRNDEEVLSFLRNGGKVIVSKFFYTYLDYNYHMTPLRKVYSFDPVPKKLETSYHNNILGIESPLWTEWVPTEKRLFWQLLPRLLAIAEIAWTEKENKDFNLFKQKVKTFYQLLDIVNIRGYAKLSEVDPNFLKRLLTPFTFLKGY